MILVITVVAIHMAELFLSETVIASAFGVMFKTVKNVGRMKVVDPMQVFRFPIIPGGIWPLVLGCVLHGAPCQSAVRLSACERIRACQQTRAKRIGVVDLCVLDGNVADAE